MKYAARLLLILVATILFSQNSFAWSGKVIGVTDGDTIKVLRDGKQVKIRLYGIDCPEKRQAFGQKAKQFTADLVAGKMVDVEDLDIDRYGRTVGMVRVGKMNVNEEIVRSGYGWVYRKYCKKHPLYQEWLELENMARIGKKGLWQDPMPVPPWEWRRQEKR